ncbi:unnamed protein product, partial [Anisakis simplex]|uniref:ABC transporter domain-containing protein n=1 Tax=Anisakis simplex TaxID=6269 RepID=A0A0M3JMC1_ANISI
MEKIPLNGIEDDTIKTETSGEIKVELDNFSAVWERAEADDSKEQTLAIKNVSLSAKPGQLVAIVGPVGSGKSSLVSSILHETEQVGGTIKVMGRIAYVSQDAWIFNGTIRENILFGKVYEEAKYNDVIRMCALDKDLKQFSNLDETLVGDRGHSLSGGQKVRIGLARAIYSDADIYL